jgi:hypothetical protein
VPLVRYIVHQLWPQQKLLAMWMDQVPIIAAQNFEARWFRLRFEFRQEIQTTTVPPSAPPEEAAERRYDVPHRAELGDRAPTRRLPRIGKCIYCGATEFVPGSGRKLSEEHVVSEGLGGSLVLPEASCEACANKTKKIEGNVLRTVLWAPRRHLKIRGKKRKRAESLYPVTAIVDGKDVVMHLPLDAHPTMLFLMVFNAPGILCARTVGRSGIQGAWAQELGNRVQGFVNRGVRNFASPSMDTVRFCQLLAKIAHGFAVAELGLDGFMPMLPPFILREFGAKENWPNCYHVVGGNPFDWAPDEALHVLGWGFPDSGHQYLVVLIRLFANLGAPIFQVVVGEVTEEQKARAIALGEARERTRGRTPAPGP